MLRQRTSSVSNPAFSWFAAPTCFHRRAVHTQWGFHSTQLLVHTSPNPVRSHHRYLSSAVASVQQPTDDRSIASPSAPANVHDQHGSQTDGGRNPSRSGMEVLLAHAEMNDELKHSSKQATARVNRGETRLFKEKKHIQLLTNRQRRKRAEALMSTKSSTHTIINKEGILVPQATVSRGYELVFWREIVRLLWGFKNIDKKQHGDGRAVYLSLETLVKLTGVSHANNWVHPSRDGCHIQVLDHTNEYKGKRRVFLRGSRRAMSLAYRYLLSEEQSLFPGVVSLEKKDVIETSLAKSAAKPEYRTRQRRMQTPNAHLEVIVEPEVWSLRTFAEYVEALTADLNSAQVKWIMREAEGMNDLPDLGDSANPNLQRREFFHVVAGHIDRLFTTPQLAPYITSLAQESALRYLLKYFQLRRGRSFHIITSVIASGTVQTQTRLWNLLLDAALQNQSIEFIQSLFRLARDADIPIDSGTAFLILKRTNFPEIKSSVNQWLIEHQMLHRDRLVQRYIVCIFKDLAQAYLSRGTDVRSLFRKFDENLGPLWLMPQTVHKLLEICGDKRLIEEGEAILELMTKRGISRTSNTAFRMANIYRRTRKIEKLVELLTSDWVCQSGREDRWIIPFAFMTAYNTRCYNLCRFLWHHACVSGVLTNIMRQLVYWAAIRNFAKEASKHMPSDPERRYFKLTAGKIIAGVCLNEESLATNFPSLREAYTQLHGDVAAYPTKWLQTAPIEDRTNHRELLQTIIKSDINAILNFEKDYHFSEMLRKAYDMDMQWQSQNMHEKGVFWMIDNAIKIPLKVREKPINLTRNQIKEEFDETDLGEDILEKLGENEKGPADDDLYGNHEDVRFDFGVSPKTPIRPLTDIPIWKQGRMLSHD